MLSDKDKCILEDFKKDLKYDGPIHEAQYNNSFREDTKVPVCYMYINSRKMCIDLESLGYISNRTSMPPISPQLEKHFIRGYFDGDGCISVYDSKQPSHNKKKYYDVQRAEFSITTQEEILIQFRDIFEKECNVSKGIKLKRSKRTSKAVSLRYGGRQQIISLYHYLYDDATIYLQRKYDNFQNVLNK